jgi:hypothetical protein
MKKLTISIFTVMLLTLATFSQETFFTQIDDDSFHIPMDILITQDGNMLFCSQYQLANYNWNSIMFEVDNSGEIVNEWTFNNTGDEYLRCARMLQLDDHIYLFGEGHKNNTADVSMLKFDMQLNEVEHDRYNINGINPGRLFPLKVLCRDNLFHIVGLARLTNTYQPPFYLKTSPSGFMLHSSYYNPGPYVEMWPQDFYLSPGSDNLFTICQDWNVNNNSWAHFIVFDTTMSVVSDLPITTGSLGFIMLSYTIFRDSDSTFYLAHNYWDINQPGGWNSEVTRFDLNGNTLNSFVFQCQEDSASWIAHYNGMDTLPDGNLILCTTWNLDREFNVQQEPTKIMLFKLSPTLDLIWQKYLFGEKGMYEAYGVKAHPDGGIVVLGAYSPTPSTNPDIKEVFLMKTDSDGLLTGIENEKQKITSTEAIIYPNPAGEQITVDFSRLYTSATLQLMDISGKTIFISQLTSNRQTIDISALPSGTYLYRISNQKGLEETGKFVVK